MGRQKLHKEVGEVVKYAEGLGYEFIGQRGSGHFLVRHRNGSVIIPASPSGGRWKANTLSQLRKTARGDGRA